MPYRVLIWILSIAAMSGCATTLVPMTINCYTIKAAQLTTAGKRIDLQSFSVQAPEEAARWCIGLTGRGKLILNTHPLMGQHIEKPERQMAYNTLAMAAIELKHGTTGFGSLVDLQDFVEKWIQSGLGVEGTEASLIVNLRDDARFTVSNFTVRPVHSPLALCVRYEYRIEERNNPVIQNTALIIHDYGKVCQHPNSQSNIVLMSLSERFPVGKQINPELFQTLQMGIAETFFDSLEF